MPILLKIHNNYYLHKDSKFLSFGKNPNTPYGTGCWFNCSYDQVEWLKDQISSGNYEIKTSIPGNPRVFMDNILGD